MTWSEKSQQKIKISELSTFLETVTGHSYPNLKRYKAEQEKSENFDAFDTARRVGVDYIEIDQQKFIDQMLKILEEKFWNIAEPQ